MIRGGGQNILRLYLHHIIFKGMVHTKDKLYLVERDYLPDSKTEKIFEIGHRICEKSNFKSRYVLEGAVFVT